MSKELIEYMKTHDVCEGDVKSLIEDYESQAREIEELKAAIQRPDRKELQAEGKHPAPCAKFCEATAFGIEIRGLKAEIEQLKYDNELLRNLSFRDERDQLRAALVVAVDALNDAERTTRKLEELGRMAGASDADLLIGVETVFSKALTRCNEVLGRCPAMKCWNCGIKRLINRLVMITQSFYNSSPNSLRTQRWRKLL